MVEISGRKLKILSSIYTIILVTTMCQNKHYQSFNHAFINNCILGNVVIPSRQYVVKLHYTLMRQMSFDETSIESCCAFESCNCQCRSLTLPATHQLYRKGVISNWPLLFPIFGCVY